jgi:hypothetical protein
VVSSLWSIATAGGHFAAPLAPYPGIIDPDSSFFNQQSQIANPARLAHPSNGGYN